MKHITLAALAASLALSLVGVAGAATVTTTTPDDSTITLSATGTLTRAPDLATVDMTIESTDDSAAKATLDNNNRYNGLVGKVMALGLARDAVKTTSYGLNTYLDGAKKTFNVTRTVSIRVENIDNAGKVIDAGIAANVSNIGGVSYGLRDPQAAYRAALADAMTTAQANGKILADSAHAKVVRIKSIATYSNPPIYRPQVQAMARMAASATPQLPTEVLPGGLTVTATVTVVYIIAS